MVISKLITEKSPDLASLLEIVAFVHNLHVATAPHGTADRNIDGIWNCDDIAAAIGAIAVRPGRQKTAFLALIGRLLQSLHDDQRIDPLAIDLLKRRLDPNNCPTRFSRLCYQVGDLFRDAFRVGVYADLHGFIEHLGVTDCHVHRESSNDQALPRFWQQTAEQSHIIVRPPN